MSNNEEIDTLPPPSWLGEALLPKTSPVVGWTNDAMAEVKRINAAMVPVRRESARNVASLAALSEEMEAAWAAK